MKIAIIVFLALILGFLGWGIYGFVLENRELAEKAAELEVKTAVLKESIAKSESEIKYYSDEANLLKELKSQFNYREPGEKLMIVIPASSTKLDTR